jgi:hypothetical protein
MEWRWIKEKGRLLSATFRARSREAVGLHRAVTPAGDVSADLAIVGAEVTISESHLEEIA